VDGKIVAEKENVRIEGHRVNLKDEEMRLREEIAGIYRISGLTPPSKKEIMEKFPKERNIVTNLLTVMINTKTLVKINEDLYFYRESIDRLKKDYRELLVRDGEASPASFKEMTGLSRKFIIPLMEFFDKTKLTIRVKDHRILREEGN